MEDHEIDQVEDKNGDDINDCCDTLVEIQKTQPKISLSTSLLPFRKGSHYWILVSLSIIVLVGGQCSATLLTRFYFENGGKSKWLITLIPNVGWPILTLPLVYFRQHEQSSLTSPLKPKLFLIYIGLGLYITADNLLYTWGISYLPVSTFSILSSTQLAFNAIFAYLLVGQKIGAYVLNSLVLLTFSAALLSLSHSSSDPHGKISSSQFVLGYVYTVSASVAFGLLLPLMQLAFTKVLGNESVTAVLEMQIYTSVVGTVVCMSALYLSGELKKIREEAIGFKAGKIAYSMALLWTAIGWQLHSVGLIGLISLVSSLFSNVISTVTLPIVPILAVVFFNDRMDFLKVMALLMGMWGFVSYVFGGYMDSKAAEIRVKKRDSEINNSNS